MSQIARFRIERLEEVIATLGYIPSGLIGALSALNFDTVDHHRKHVIRHGSEKFSNPPRAKRMIASRLFRYGSRERLPAKLTDVEGEGFMASLDRDRPAKGGGEFNMTRESIRALEFGGTISTSEPMAIPIGAGTVASGPFRGQPTARFRRALREGEFGIVNTAGRTRLLVLELSRSRRKGVTLGARSQIMGILTRRRRQRPLLGFYRSWSQILPRHLPKYDDAIEMALTAAGRETLDKRNKAIEAGRTAFRSTFDQYLRANPQNKREARQTAERAARAARRQALAPKGRA